MEIILGSSSQWRQSLAKKYLGDNVILMPPDIDERQISNCHDSQNPQKHTSIIARAKLDHLLSKLKTHSTTKNKKIIVICCDTIEYFNGEILEKPKDTEDCLRMIRLWSKNGCRTEIYTSIAIGGLCTQNDNFQTFIETDVQRADLVMVRDFTNDEIMTYIKNKDCMKSSGAVIIDDVLQSGAGIVEGDKTVIEGLPIPSVLTLIKKIEAQMTPNLS